MDNEARNERIRALVANGWTYSEVAAKVGCTRNAVAGVMKRATGYKRTDPPTGRLRGEDHQNAKISEADVREILVSLGRPADLAERFGIALSTVYHIREVRSWKHVA